MIRYNVLVSSIFFLSLFFHVAVTSAQSEMPDLFSTTKANQARVSVLPKEIATKRSRLLTIKSNFLGSNKLPSKLQFNLFDDVQIPIVLEKKNHSTYKNLEVYWGRSDDKRFAHLPHYRDVVVVYNPNTEKITAHINTNKGKFQITPTDIAGQYKVAELETGEINCSDLSIKSDAINAYNTISESAAATVGCNEMDANGKYVADLFIGYSYQAATIANDIDAHALTMVEEVNTGLSNSLVSNIYVRLVGTGIDSHNPGVVTSVLGDVYTWFANDIALSAPDFVASVQVPTGAAGEAGGWAGVGGYSSVNSIYSAAAVFRHEIGHNIGSSHCTAGIRPYAAGYNNGHVATHMCGNNINFYSTPLIVDDLGLPIGNAATADNARVWRERAATVSANRRHTILFDANDRGCSSQPIANGNYHIQHINSNKYIGTVGASNSSGTNLALADSSANTRWKVSYIGDNKYLVIHKVSGRSIDVPGGSSTAGENLIIWNTTGGNNQTFIFEKSGTDTYKIRPTNGLCFQVENLGTTNGSIIEQNTCAETANNYWRFVPYVASSVLSVSVATTSIACYGTATGSATVNATGGTGNYTYLWSNGATTKTISNIVAGAYFVTVSDGTSSLKYSFSITQAKPFDISLTKTQSTKLLDGTATAVVAGGTVPYTLRWSNGQTGNTATNLVPNVYNLQVTDATGCVNTKAFTIVCNDQYKPCDDGNKGTVGDVYDANCACHGTPVVCTTTHINVAKNKTATQSSTYGSAIANRAVDGNLDGVYGNGSVAHTNDENNPWWQVDLGANYQLSDIVVWNRTDCCQERMDSVYVLVSQTPFTSTNLQTTLAQSGVSAYPLMGRKYANGVVSPNLMGRYVRLQASYKTATSSLNIAEVEVFTCGTPLATALTANPVQNSTYELKGFILRQDAVVNAVTLEHGAGNFNTTSLYDTTGKWKKDTLWIVKNVAIGAATTYQFRIRVTSNTVSLLSNEYRFNVQNAYCTPDNTTNYIWYKSFRSVSFNGKTYTNGGVEYVDNSATLLGELDMGGTYSLTMATANAGWTNLYYNVYLDLNNDKSFNGYNELIGSAMPSGQNTMVTIKIPTDNLRIGENLRLRIQGHEGGTLTSCNADIGNYVDYSVKIKAGACTGSGSLTTLYLDADNDGYGNPSSSIYGNCAFNTGYVLNNTDFNDTNATVYPNAVELCDGLDNDGDGLVDEGGVWPQNAVTLSNTTLILAKYGAAQTITTNGNVNVNQGTTTQLITNGKVDLNPGVTIGNVAVFKITIQAGCGN